MGMRYKERLNRLASLLQPNGLSAYIIWDGTDLFYFCGVPGPGILIVLADGQAKLYVPPINYEAAERYAAPGIDIERTRINEPLEMVAAQAIAGINGSVGIDKIDVESYRRLASMLPNVEMRPSQGLIWEMRVIKDPSEIILIREACRISDRAMKAAADVLAPGITENEVKSEIVSEIYKGLGDRAAFDVIVASSDRSSLPHGPLSTSSERDRKIAKGDVVLIDLGVVVEGYCSDITRTFLVGESAESEVNSVYEITLRAKETAESFMKPGSSCSYIDSVARRVLAEKGFDEYFNHSLGHGLGLEIHEPPRIGPGSADQLSENMVVTCEPGVYLEGKWGIRIEDTLLITEKGPEPLTSYPLTEHLII